MVWISDFPKYKGTLACQSELGGPEEVTNTCQLPVKLIISTSNSL